MNARPVRAKHKPPQHPNLRATADEIQAESPPVQFDLWDRYQAAVSAGVGSGERLRLLAEAVKAQRQ